MDQRTWNELTGGQDRAISQVAGFTVGSSEIEDLDAKIRNLNTDIQSQSNDPLLILNWTNFFADWEIWRANHVTLLQQSAIPVFGEPNVGTEFESYISEYNERLRFWKAHGLTTAAARSTTADTFLDTVANAVTSSVGFAGGIAVTLGLGAGLFYLASRVLASSKKRTA